MTNGASHVQLPHPLQVIWMAQEKSPSGLNGQVRLYSFVPLPNTDGKETCHTCGSRILCPMPSNRVVHLVPLILLTLSSCSVGRFFLYNFADTRDNRKFPSRPLPASTTPFTYPDSRQQLSPGPVTHEGSTLPFEQFLQAHRTVAFLIIKHDSVAYEHYFNGYDRSRVHPSFSMAKSITGILIGCAIADGYIRDIQQPVTDFIPEMRKNGWDRVTVEHVLQMTSGMDFNESYVNPFGPTAKFYYGRRLYKHIFNLKLKRQPGERFEYVSGGSQILGSILERAIRSKGDSTRTVTAYLNEKLWSPLGMEYPASWSIDRKHGGLEKTFCCVNAPARDFAKLGSLYLHKGGWQGQQLVPLDWAQSSTHASNTQGSAPFYQYQWWLTDSDGAFMAQGIMGQYVYVDPSRELVIVRLGSNYGGVEWLQVFQNIAREYP